MGTPASRKKVIVSSIVDLTHKVKCVTFRTVGPEPLIFEAGQYMVFIINEHVRRSLSIASAPSDKNTFDVCVDISPQGPGSMWINQLRVGDEVSCIGPVGKFVLDQNTSGSSVFIATGTGIGPIRSMIIENLYLHQASGVKRQVNLYWGLRYQADVFWQEAFQSLANEFPDFHFYICLSKPDVHHPGNTTVEALPLWKGQRGRVTDNIDLSTCDEKTTFYICGGGETTKSIKEWLLEKGIGEEKIRTELF